MPNPVSSSDSLNELYRKFDEAVGGSIMSPRVRAPELNSIPFQQAPCSTSSQVQLFVDMMNTEGGAEISFCNTVDDAPPPSQFRYISSCIYRPPVPCPDPSFLIGCDCAEQGGCISGSCLCISQNNRAQPAYDSQGRVQFSSGPIYECNQKCGCPPSCPNRVIQRGRQVPLTITRFADGKGWGVTATKPIPAGTFVGLYLGEVITSIEANGRFLRAKENGPADQSGSYLFDLDFNYESGTESEFTIDAYAYGNLTHFINHSCDPNLRVHPCFIDTLDPRLHHLAFFAFRDIPEGGELCFDYLGNQTAPTKSPENVSALACSCKSPKCRGYVY